MQFAPTWDLFILVFFAIIVAYSFIIGKNSTLKIIISSYIAILTADGIGNLFNRFLLSADAILPIFPAGDPDSLIVIKILTFVLTLMILTIRGSFFVEVGKESSWLTEFTMNAAFGFLSAGLIVATILVYMSGGSFVFDPMILTKTSMNLTTGSVLAEALTQNYNIWFALPAIAFVVSSFTGNEGGGGGGHEEHGEVTEGHHE